MTQRVLIVVIVGLMALAVAWLARRGAVVRRRGYLGPPQPSSVTLFASDTCVSCTLVGDRLDDLGVVHERVTWERASQRFRDAHVDKVPTIVVRESEPSESSGHQFSMWMAQGVPTGGQLRRWLRPVPHDLHRGP